MPNFGKTKTQNNTHIQSTKKWVQNYAEPIFSTQLHCLNSRRASNRNAHKAMLLELALRHLSQ